MKLTPLLVGATHRNRDTVLHDLLQTFTSSSVILWDGKLVTLRAAAELAKGDIYYAALRSQTDRLLHRDHGRETQG